MEEEEDGMDEEMKGETSAEWGAQHCMGEKVSQVGFEFKEWKWPRWW